MSSKVPPTGDPAPEGRMEGKGCNQLSALPRSRASSLTQQIADALQVPVSVLFSPPDQVEAVIESRNGSCPSAEDLTAEYAALLRAYTCIRGPVERRRYLSLLQEAAERSQAVKLP